MFYPFCSPFAGYPAVAQIRHETRIARGETAELGPGHVVRSQEALDLSKQVQGGLPV